MTNDIHLSDFSAHADVPIDDYLGVCISQLCRFFRNVQKANRVPRRMLLNLCSAIIGGKATHFEFAQRQRLRHEPQQHHSYFALDAERMLRAMESLRFDVERAKVAVTANCRISETETTAKALKDSDGRADEAFYVSKSEGRNRCVKGVPRMLPPRDLNSTSANVPFHETSNAQS